MDITTQQFIILLGITFAQMVAMALPYWIGRTTGLTRGRATGYQSGYDDAVAKLMPEQRELKDRCRSAERLLSASAAELRSARGEHAKARSHAAETIEELTTRLDDAQSLAATDATLLRQAANNLDLAATTWSSLTADRKAEDARTLSRQLRDRAGWLKPEDVPTEKAA